MENYSSADLLQMCNAVAEDLLMGRLQSLRHHYSFATNLQI
jgi:hypothetical protein